MISSSIIVLRIIAAVICFLFPLSILIYFKRKEKISLKAVIAGIVVFILFATVLEQLLHSVVLGKHLITNPTLIVVYGALAAGLFEEVGRFIIFKSVLKNKHEWKDGLAYGIGHGGIEALLIGVITNIQFIIYSNLINSGLFESTLVSKLPASQANQLLQLKEVLIQTTTSSIILGIAERVFALGIQIALTMVVLYAVRYRKNIYLLIAILLHALMDVPAALYQGHIINAYIAETFVFVYFIIAVIFLSKTRSIFSKADGTLSASSRY